MESTQKKDSLSNKAATATKWSLVTQVASKLISPVTTLILAHLLAPEVFGCIALVTMVTSFADLFSDAGFQKYLVQHEYENGDEFDLSCNVAFWTNLVASLVLWGCIALGSDALAAMLGDATLNTAITVACASLPLTAAVSVQTAVYQRGFDFRTLFYSKVGSSLLIMLVSVPLAYFGFGYWAMIAGTIASNFLLAIWLTLRSAWRPAFKYSIAELRVMFSFSAWTLVEQLSIWMTNWLGTFILGTMMTSYYLGLYNTSVSLVNSVIAIVTGAVNPIVFATLSRIQTDRDRFDSAFYKMQGYLGLAVVPIAVALWAYSDAVVCLYLGKQWVEAAAFFGLYSLSSAFVVVFGHIASDAYRSLGKPKYSLLAQLGFLLFQAPGLIIGASYGFAVLSWVVPLFRLLGCVVTHSLICKFLVGLSPAHMMTNLRWVYLATFLVVVPSLAIVWLLNLGYYAQCVLIVVDGLAYFVLCLFFKSTRHMVLDLAGRFGFSGPLGRVLPGTLRDVK